LTRIPVKPEVLVWARETAGLDVPTTEQRVGVKVDRLEEWEARTATPTIVCRRNGATRWSSVSAKPEYAPAGLGAQRARRHLSGFRSNPSARWRRQRVSEA
jgi:hypothetical protein